VVKFGTKWLDLDARVLRDDDGVEHPLTASEFSLLKAFAEHPKRVLTRERRVATQDRRSRFFGTDFSFEDLEERDVNQYRYALDGEDTVSPSFGERK